MAMTSKNPKYRAGASVYRGDSNFTKTNSLSTIKTSCSSGGIDERTDGLHLEDNTSSHDQNNSKSDGMLTSLRTKNTTDDDDKHKQERKSGTTDSHSRQKEKKKQQQQRPRRKKATPCSAIRSIHQSYVQHVYESQLKQLLELCRADSSSPKKNNSNKNPNNNNNNSSSNLMSKQKQQQQQDHQANLYRQVKHILSKNPNVIHGIDSINGCNALHYICSSPDIGNHLKLVQLLIQTSLSIQAKTHQTNNSNKNVKRGSNSSTSTSNSDDGLQALVVNYSAVDADTTIVPTLLIQPNVRGETPFNLLCQNRSIGREAMSTRLHGSFRSLGGDSSLGVLDVMDYMLKCNPTFSCASMGDAFHHNLPLHNICIMVAFHSVFVPIEIMLLIVQHYPKACSIPNGDGDLPLHLLANIHSPQTEACTRKVEVVVERDSDDDIDSLKDLNLDDDEDDLSDDDGDQFKHDRDRLDNEDDDDDDGYDNDHEQQEEVIFNAHRYCQNVVLPLNMVSEGERLDMEYREEQRFKNQLELIQYLVHVYPEALKLQNDNGFTPAQVAMTSASKHCRVLSPRKFINSGSMHANVEREDGNPDGCSNCHSTSSQASEDSYHWDPIVNFFKNPIGYKDGMDHEEGSINSHQDGAASICSNSQHGSNIGKDGFVIDVSGREVDDSIKIEPSPWNVVEDGNVSRTERKLLKGSSIDSIGGGGGTGIGGSTNHVNSPMKKNLRLNNDDNDLLTKALKVLEDASERGNEYEPFMNKTRQNLRRVDSGYSLSSIKKIEPSRKQQTSSHEKHSLHNGPSIPNKPTTVANYSRYDSMQSFGSDSVPVRNERITNNNNSSHISTIRKTNSAKTFSTINSSQKDPNQSFQNYRFEPPSKSPIKSPPPCLFKQPSRIHVTSEASNSSDSDTTVIPFPKASQFPMSSDSSFTSGSNLGLL